MKKIIALASLLMVSLNAVAQEKAITVAYESGHIPVSSSVEIEAEYLALELQLNASADSAAERAALTSSLINALTLAATKDLSFEFQVADLAVAPYARGAPERSDSPGSTHYLLTLLSPEETVYDATQKLHSFLKQIQVPDKTSITAGKTALAVSDPESYRDQLLHLLEKELKTLAKVYGGSTRIHLHGLETPVNVRRKNDKKVSLYLNHQVSVEMKP